MDILAGVFAVFGILVSLLDLWGCLLPKRHGPYNQAGDAVSAIFLLTNSALLIYVLFRGAP